MKVIEYIRDNRTGVVRESSWGNNITDDLTVIASVVNILKDERSEPNPSLKDRFTTVSITIEL